MQLFEMERYQVRGEFHAGSRKGAKSEASEVKKAGGENTFQLSSEG
jgi:hypothetical protein